jgi:hypothetical protein
MKMECVKKAEDIKGWDIPAKFQAYPANSAPSTFQFYRTPLLVDAPRCFRHFGFRL